MTQKPDRRVSRERAGGGEGGEKRGKQLLKQLLCTRSRVLLQMLPKICKQLSYSFTAFIPQECSVFSFFEDGTVSPSSSSSRIVSNTLPCSL